MQNNRKELLKEYGLTKDRMDNLMCYVIESGLADKILKMKGSRDRYRFNYCDIPNGAYSSKHRGQNSYDKESSYFGWVRGLLREIIRIGNHPNHPVDTRVELKSKCLVMNEKAMEKFREGRARLLELYNILKD